MFTLNCKGKLLVINEPIVMGIINITADSFYKGHLQSSNGEILMLAERMIADGAAIVDIGGQSTKPGSISISAEEELERVLPVIETLHKNLPGAILSIDTYYSKVAVAAVNAGASVVNDISAGNMDAAMLSTVGTLNVPYVCMHMQGIPETMQKAPVYNDLIKDIIDFFIAKIEACKQAGIKDIIIDPGFGFGKTIAHNFELLKALPVFSILDKPLLVGLSRKGTIYRTLNITAEEALNGTTTLNTIALMNGAAILRVHDVREAKEAIQLFTAYKKAP